MSTIPIRAAGIPWYRREDYARLRKLFKDGHKLPPTFDQWLKLAEQTKQRLEAQGNITVKAYIDPDSFAAWCAARGLNIDAEARTQFAAWVAAKQYRDTH